MHSVERLAEEYQKGNLKIKNKTIRWGIVTSLNVKFEGVFSVPGVFTMEDPVVEFELGYRYFPGRGMRVRLVNSGISIPECGKLAQDIYKLMGIENPTESVVQKLLQRKNININNHDILRFLYEKSREKFKLWLADCIDEADSWFEDDDDFYTVCLSVGANPEKGQKAGYISLFDCKEDADGFWQDRKGEGLKTFRYEGDESWARIA